MNLMILGTAATLLAVLERSPRWRFRAAPLLRAYFTSDVTFLLTGFVAGGALATAYVAAASGWVETFAQVPRLGALGLPLYVTVPLALVALDLGNYVAHWALHRFDILWELHKVHHSSRTLDWLATFRSHIIEQVFRRLLAPALLIVVGFPTASVLLAGSLFVVWAMLNHANLRLRLGVLESVLITPGLHRVHHVPETSEHNLGTMFTFWDRLRGTLLTTTPDTTCDLGVPGEVATYPQGWLAQLVEPLVRLTRSRAPVGTGQDLLPV